jgi:hypothetical protein
LLSALLSPDDRMRLSCWLENLKSNVTAQHTQLTGL